MVVDGAVHEERAHLMKLGALEWFGQYIRPHLLGRAKFKIYFACAVEMTNEEVFCFDMIGSF